MHLLTESVQYEQVTVLSRCPLSGIVQLTHAALCSSYSKITDSVNFYDPTPPPPPLPTTKKMTHRCCPINFLSMNNNNIVHNNGYISFF